MPKFTVAATISFGVEFVTEADDEDAAIERVKAELDDITGDARHEHLEFASQTLNPYESLGFSKSRDFTDWYVSDYDSEDDEESDEDDDAN